MFSGSVPESCSYTCSQDGYELYIWEEYCHQALKGSWQFLLYRVWTKVSELIMLQSVISAVAIFLALSSLTLYIAK